MVKKLRNVAPFYWLVGANYFLNAVGVVHPLIPRRGKECSGNQGAGDKYRHDSPCHKMFERHRTALIF